MLSYYLTSDTTRARNTRILTDGYWPSLNRGKFDVWPDACKSRVLAGRASKPRNITPRSKSVVDAPQGAEHDYYGTIILDTKTGPRRELTLRIETWPKGKVTFGGGEAITLHFAAIVDYEEVQRFFSKVRMDGLHYLRELSESNPHRHVIEM